MMVRSTVRPESVEEVDAAIEKTFAAIDAAAPDTVRYASLKLSDGVTYVVLLQVADGADNPLPAIPEFVEFQQKLRGWVSGPPAAEQLTVQGSYRLF